MHKWDDVQNGWRLDETMPNKGDNASMEWRVNGIAHKQFIAINYPQTLIVPHTNVRYRVTLSQ